MSQDWYKNMNNSILESGNQEISEWESRTAEHKKNLVLRIQWYGQETACLWRVC